MLRSVSAFCVLFRHALMALGQPARSRQARSRRCRGGADRRGRLRIPTILDFREGKRKEKEIDVEATLQTYLEFVEVVTNEVDRRLDVLSTYLSVGGQTILSVLLTS